MVKRAIALLVTVTITLPACATTTAPRLQTANAPVPTTRDRELLADYVQKLAVGSRVRVHMLDGSRERGTLMDANGERIVIQPRARIPEAPREIRLDGVLSVELDNGNGSVGRAIAIGVAAGAGAILGVMLLLAAIYSD